MLNYPSRDRARYCTYDWHMLNYRVPLLFFAVSMARYRVPLPNVGGTYAPPFALSGRPGMRSLQLFKLPMTPTIAMTELHPRMPPVFNLTPLLKFIYKMAPTNSDSVNKPMSRTSKPKCLKYLATQLVRIRTS